MNDERSFERTAREWLELGANQAPDRAVQAVLLAIETTPQERDLRIPWRTPSIMNKFVPIGLAAAAVVVALVIGTQLLGTAAPGGVGAPASATPTPTAEPSVAAPSSPADGSLAEGPFHIGKGAVPITIDIASSGWFSLPDFEAVSKDDDGLDPPETVGAALLAWAWPAGTGFYVYGDPCQWSTTIPETPATTPDEIAVGLAAQASRDATAPVDVTVGGYAGKTVTLRVPMSYEVPGATREEEFADCDQDVFGSYAAEGDTEPSRNHQGPGQIDELWILDVDGKIVILDAMYGPAVPAALVDEMRAIARSATFEVP